MPVACALHLESIQCSAVARVMQFQGTIGGYPFKDYRLQPTDRLWSIHTSAVWISCYPILVSNVILEEDLRRSLEIQVVRTVHCKRTSLCRIHLVLISPPLFQPHLRGTYVCTPYMVCRMIPTAYTGPPTNWKRKRPRCLSGALHFLTHTEFLLWASLPTPRSRLLQGWGVHFLFLQCDSSLLS